MQSNTKQDLEFLPTLNLKSREYKLGKKDFDTEDRAFDIAQELFKQYHHDRSGSEKQQSDLPKSQRIDYLTFEEVEVFLKDVYREFNEDYQAVKESQFLSTQDYMNFLKQSDNEDKSSSQTQLQVQQIKITQDDFTQLCKSYLCPATKLLRESYEYIVKFFQIQLNGSDFIQATAVFQSFKFIFKQLGIPKYTPDENDLKFQNIFKLKCQEQEKENQINQIKKPADSEPGEYNYLQIKIELFAEMFYEFLKVQGFEFKNEVNFLKYYKKQSSQQQQSYQPQAQQQQQQQASQ